MTRMSCMQFLAWDTFARRRVDMIGRKDKGDTVVAHEFDYKIEKQVGWCQNHGTSHSGVSCNNSSRLAP